VKSKRELATVLFDIEQDLLILELLKIRLSNWQGHLPLTFLLRHLVDPGFFMLESGFKTPLVLAGTTLATSRMAPWDSTRFSNDIFLL
jgi:hypothetical protein